MNIDRYEYVKIRNQGGELPIEDRLVMVKLGMALLRFVGASRVMGHSSVHETLKSYSSSSHEWENEEQFLKSVISGMDPEDMLNEFSRFGAIAEKLLALQE
jgi:hypothetical protein